MSGFADNARSAVVWNAGCTILSMVLQFFTTAILTRHLPQNAYGHFSFVTDLISFISIFSMTNFIVHTIQVKNEDEVCWQDHFLAAGVLNIVMMLVMNVVAGILWYLPIWREAAPLVHVMSVTFLLSWPKEFCIKILERGFEWKRMRILHTIGAVVSAMLAVSMVISGCGTYSLLVPGLCTSIPFIYELFVRKSWRPTWQWSWYRFQPAFYFGVRRMGSGIAYYGRQVLVSSVFGATLSFAALGVLNRSIGLAQMFCIQIASQILSAIYPILTRLGEDNGNPARAGGLVVQTIAWIAVPTAVAFVISATPLVTLVYGTNWMAVIPLLPWSMAWGVAFSLYWSVYHLLVARNQQGKCLIADVANLLGTALALSLALPHGMIRYLQVLLGMQLIVFFLVGYWLNRSGGITLSGWFRPICAALACALIAALCANGTLHLKGVTASISLGPCLFASLIFIIIYILALRALFRSQIDEWLNYVPMQSYLRKIVFLSKSN